MALYNKPSPFGAMPQQNLQSTQSMQNSQFFNAGFSSAPQQNIMTMSQPAGGFSQFPAQNQGWPNDGGFMTPNQPSHTHSAAFSSPPAQQKPATSAFDDLFAVGTAHFASVPAANNPQNNFANKTQTPATTASTAAHQDLESLFM